MAFTVRRKVVLFCLLLAVVRRAAGQGLIGVDLPCQDPIEDPDSSNPLDNLSCPRLDDELQCYSVNELCDGVILCQGGSDEGGEEGGIASLECDMNQFVCTPGTNIPTSELCDGVNNCNSGDDETTTLCENKCLLPYYGGCPYSRRCITSEFDVNCGGCLPGFFPDPNDLDGSGPCDFEIGFEFSFYFGSEDAQQTGEICVVFLADTSQLVNDIRGIYDDPTFNIQPVGAVITTQMTGDASASDDYNPQEMFVTLDEDTTRFCIEIEIRDDLLIEGAELFGIVLEPSTPNAVVGDGRGSASVSILDNDEAVMAVFQQVQYNVDEDVVGGVVEICVAIVSPFVTSLGLDSSVTVSFTGGTASAGLGQDYLQEAQPSDVLDFVAGSPVTDNVFTTSSQCFNVPILNDVLVDPGEFFDMSLIGPMGFIAVDPTDPRTETTVFIDDDDLQVTAVYEPDSYFVNEADGTVQACVSIISGSPNPSTLSSSSSVVVTFLSGGSATQGVGQDYIASATPSILNFDVGDLVTNDPSTSTSVCFDVPINNDNLVEANENFFLGLGAPTGLIVVDPTRSDSRATVTIGSEDRPSIGFEPITYTANEESNGNIEVCIQLFSSGDHPFPIQFSLSTADGSASANMDYSPVTNRQLSFPANSQFQEETCTNIDILDDNVLEGSMEDFFANIAPIGNVDIVTGREQATINLFQTDSSVFGFDPPTYSVLEGDSVPEVCIALTGASINQNINLRIESSDGSAQVLAGDYDAVDMLFTFPANSRRACFSVSTNEDDLLEDDEVFDLSVSLETPINLVSVDPNGDTATVTITNDDSVIVTLVDPPAVSEGDVDVMVCADIISGGIGPGQSVMVTLTTSDISSARSQSPDADYTAVSVDLEFTESNFNVMLCVNIPIVDDLICEGPETFRVTLSETDPDVTLSGSSRVVTIEDNDVAEISLTIEMPSPFQDMILTECADEGLYFRVELATAVTKGPNRQCVISVTAEDGSAEAGSDYTPLSGFCTLTTTNTECEFHIGVVDDFVAEFDESFNIILTSDDPSVCSVLDANTTITIRDDEDCDDEDICGELFAMCEELMCPDNFTCIPGPDVGDDPHFAVTLSSGKTLCYTVQGEHGFAFNLISNQKVYMNAMFVPDALREEVTWLGTMGIVINNNGYKKSNMTKLRFEAIKNTIHIDNQMVLEARNIERITFVNGKLIISEAPPSEGYKQPFVRVDLKDVELSFSIKFMTEHLDLYWHSTGQIIADSHGLIGQFFQDNVVLDEVRKMLILPGKEPVPVQRKPLWAFMEREMGDSTNFCWVAMNPGYQGEGLIDGSYFDYLVDDVLSTEFKFKKL